jgi:hypothetical protein
MVGSGLKRFAKDKRSSLFVQTVGDEGRSFVTLTPARPRLLQDQGQGWFSCCSMTGVRKLTGENLKVVWTDFSTLSKAVFLLRKKFMVQAHPCLKLKPWPRFHLGCVGLSNSCLNLNYGLIK